MATVAYLRSALKAAARAPSPLNGQPWEFIAITNQESKEKIFSEGERCRRVPWQGRW
jgi:nitroreductase